MVALFHGISTDSFRPDHVAPDDALRGRPAGEFAGSGGGWATGPGGKSLRDQPGEGLFLLATERIEGPLPPTFSYWRDFAVSYLTVLCHTPEIAGLELEAIPPPTSAELADATELS